MSKQEKLTAFLEAFGHFNGSRDRRLLEQAVDAYDQWRTTPDDPPQPPEMPECVSRLCNYLDQTIMHEAKLLASEIRAYYRQPLKLEVGNVYEDGHEGPVQIVWKSPSPNGYRWLGVVVTNGETRWFNDDGKPSCQTPEYKLIREVKQ